jgi:phosphatidylserine synthase
MSDNNTFFWIALFAILAAIINWLGIFILYRYRNWAIQSKPYFICFAAGVLISTPLMLALPQAIEKNFYAGFTALLGFLFMFFSNGLFWISYCYGLHKLTPLNDLIFYLTIMLIFLFSWLMISEIPMFSLKIKKLTIKGNERQLLLVALFIIFTSLWGISGLAGVITMYIIISVFTTGISSRSVK